MKFITALFMAWGNFLSLPCPVKKWDGDLKNYMLAFLPIIGTIIGLLWAGLCIFFIWIGTPFLVISFLLTFLLFALCGFLHLDGFMDCCDAILSRRDLAEKQRILKDPHCGSFAVVSAVFMILAYYSCISTAFSLGIDFVDLCLIPVISRSVAAVNVILRKPIGHSQYAQGKGADDSDEKSKALLLIFIQAALLITIGLFLAGDVMATAVVILSTAALTYLSTVVAKRSLGGMSGDIAGFSIVWGELAGIFAMLVL